MEKQRINIDINKTLWKKVGIKAIEEGIQKRQLVEKAIKKYIEEKEKDDNADV